MTFVKCLVGFVCLVSFRKVASNPFVLPNSSLEASWPSNLNTIFPYPTYSPINIETARARVYPAAAPLTVTVAVNEKQLVQNTGSNVLVTLNQPKTVGRVTGGVLGTDVYIYNRVYYNWNNEALGAAGNLVDGEGPPIQITTVFYNQKYGSLTNAILHRDGVAVLVANAEVEGNIPNPLFASFEHALHQIKAAGSSTAFANTSSVSFFYNLLPFVKYYYAYPGSLIFAETNDAQPNSAIVIYFPRSFSAAISYSQFQAFQDLRNSASAPVNAVLSANPLGCRPLVESAGTNLIVFP